MSKRTERLAKKKKLILTLELVVISIVVYRLTGTLNRILIPNQFYRNLVCETVLVAMGIFSAWYLHRLAIFRFRLEGFISGIEMLLLPVLVIYANFRLCIEAGDRILVSMPETVAFFLEMLLVGVAEETAFRGLIQNALHDYLGEKTLKSKYMAIIGAGILFGMTHLINVFSGANLWSTFGQMMGAIPIGILFGAAYYRSGKNLWVVILVHGGMDAGALLHSGYLQGMDQAAILNANNAEFPWGALLVYGIADLVVLWPSKLRDT